MLAIRFYASHILAMLQGAMASRTIPVSRLSGAAMRDDIKFDILHAPLTRHDFHVSLVCRHDDDGC